MKCAKCAAEVPGQAQFCMRCGTPVGLVNPAGAVTMARGGAAAIDTSSRKKLIAGITAALLVLALAAFLGWKMLNPTSKAGQVPTGNRVVDKPGVTPTGGPLLERAGRINPGGPLTNRATVGDAPPPADVIDYLKFLKEVERRRVMLAKRQLAKLLELSATVPAGNIMAEMKENEQEISQAHNETYGGMQRSIAGWQKDWNEISQFFLTKPPPQSCVKLRDKYYDMLGKTASSVVNVGNSFSQALSGNASAALESLSNMRGTASQDIDRACDAADEELAAVCDKFKLHKDFDIKADGGGASLFGGLGALR